MDLKKRICALLLLCALFMCGSVSFSGCSETEDDGRIKVLCTIFPQYDWVRNIIGDSKNIDLSLLVDNGADMHSFQPSFADVAQIKNSDVVIYVGGESDKWVEDALAEEADGVTAIKLSAIDGMTLYEISSESHDHSHEVTDDGHAHDHHGHDHSDVFDEHVWLSVRNAEIASDYICETLCDIDVDNAETYRANTDRYIDELSALDDRLSKLSHNAHDTSLVFADRFPFVYLFEDYGIGYHAAFDGCTTDTNADFDTIIRLAKKLDELSSPCVLVTESSDGAMAMSVVSASENTAREVVVLDSMQSVIASDVDSVSYLQIMQKNIDVLEEILLDKKDRN